jgi:hypothetical protein
MLAYFTGALFQPVNWRRTGCSNGGNKVTGLDTGGGFSGGHSVFYRWLTEMIDILMPAQVNKKTQLN